MPTGLTVSTPLQDEEARIDSGSKTPAGTPVSREEPPGEASPGGEPPIEAFLGEATRDLNLWAWLWTSDRTFPLQSHRGGLSGRIVTFLKRLLRPVIRAITADLWDRQRVFNLIFLESFERRTAEHQHAIEAHASLLERFDRRITDGMGEVMRHNDALFSRVDQKLDRYRRESRELWDRLGAFIATRPEGGETLRQAQLEQTYLSLEERQRGSEDEIASRIEAYLPYLGGVEKEILDLGCGRGEALALFGEHGFRARGIDSSAEMVARCREKGLLADQGELFEQLAAIPEGSIGAVVSFHVIEHLPALALDRLVRLAWRALTPGGVLILETPSPLSLVMASRNFWIDPTHLRPVHPASLEVTFREAGFEPVHRLDLHPFAPEDRLPEIDLQTVPEDTRPLADQVNRMRDVLDDLLFGARDFAMVGERPGRVRPGRARPGRKA